MCERSFTEKMQTGDNAIAYELIIVPFEDTVIYRTGRPHGIRYTSHHCSQQERKKKNNPLLSRLSIALKTMVAISFPQILIHRKKKNRFIYIYTGRQIFRNMREPKKTHKVGNI